MCIRDRAKVKLESLNEAYLFNPRNCYQNYNAAVNGSNDTIYTYMGPLKAKYGNVTYSTSGQLSPLLNDPLYRTIGVGTRIFIGGATGYVSWRGTQFNSAAERDTNDIPKGTGGTLALIGDLKAMDTKYIRPGVFKNYGCTMYVGVGIPIPVLNTDILQACAVKAVSYTHLKSNRYVVGIQWHPEMMVRDHPMCADLFVDFVNKCKEQV